MTPVRTCVPWKLQVEAAPTKQTQEAAAVDFEAEKVLAISCGDHAAPVRRLATRKLLHDVVRLKVDPVFLGGIPHIRLETFQPVLGHWHHLCLRMPGPGAGAAYHLPADGDGVVHGIAFLECRFPGGHFRPQLGRCRIGVVDRREMRDGPARSVAP